MARYTGAVCKLCRREGQKLFLKGGRCYTNKCALERRSYAPGQHGQGRKKISEYGMQLREKQKAKRYYGVQEGQFLHYFEIAEKKAGVTGTNLLKILESRLDNVVYRAGFASKVLRYVFEPIAKRKGTSDTVTVMKSIRALREGKNVCLFPEGQKSFNGRTGEIHLATGKLVKASKASLITYKLEGGYFTTPRWGYGIRKGKMHGSIVNIYDPETLEKLSAEEITDIITDKS